MGGPSREKHYSELSASSTVIMWCMAISKQPQCHLPHWEYILTKYGLFVSDANIRSNFEAFEVEEF